MLKIISMLLLSILLSSFACAAPEDLMVNNQAIDSLCFFNLESNTKIINLKRCGLNKQKFTIKGQNEHLIQKGFIGYDIQSSEPSTQPAGYSYYKFFKAGEHQYWIYTVNNGGGSGDFTAIQLVRRKNASQLATKGIAGGDRCNGGVQDVSIKNNQVSYSVKLTAYDLIALSKISISSNKSYNDLSSCAICCVAKAVYKANTTASELQYIDLAKIKNATAMPQQGRLQECFNKLFVSYVKSGETKLPKAEFDTFVKKFNQTCLKTISLYQGR